MMRRKHCAAQAAHVTWVAVRNMARMVEVRLLMACYRKLSVWKRQGGPLVVESGRGVGDGVYEVLEGHRWEGMPVWVCGSMMLWSVGGRWCVGQKAHMGDDSLGVWVSEERHKGRMPHRTGFWLGYGAGLWEVDHRTTVKLFDATRPPPSRPLRSRFTSDVAALFYTLDTDRDGLASYEECKAGLAHLGRPYTPRDLVAAFSAIDTHNTRHLDLKDFTRLIYLLFPDISRVGEVYPGVKARRL